MFEPLPDEEQIEDVPASPNRMKIPGIILALALGVFSLGAYSVHEHNVAANASQDSAAVSASLKSTNAQIEQLNAKLAELTAKPQTAAPVEAEVKPSAHVAKASPHLRKASVRRQKDDPRWKKVQSQLDDQGKAIDSTRNDLVAAKTELNGSIARTHGELVVLQRKGERNYFEFDVNKSKQFQSLGPLGVKLRKANVKHQFADLELLVDDRSLTKKHVNLYEPAMFYTGDNEQPIQVVINGISKDHIRGYVSEPKYRKSELASMSQANDAQSAQTPTATNDTTASAKARQKLPVR